MSNLTTANSDSPSTISPSGRHASGIILLTSVFLIAICGLVYELIFGALSSYLLGNSVTQFSLVIGMFLTAMGLGSFLSRFVTQNLLRTFLLLEIIVGLIGGSSALVLFTAFALLNTYFPLLVIICAAVGTLVGLEIPLLVRVLQHGTKNLRVNLGNVLALDYLGALVASLLFPLVLVPQLGLVRTSFAFGLINVAVGLIGLHLFRTQIRRPANLWLTGIIAAILLLVGLIAAGKTTTLLEDLLYDDPVLFAKTTPYQRLVLTRWHNDLRLFIDGNIQFSSVDEFRYHEALVHPAMSLVPTPQRVLLLGAGDGLAAREVLKYTSVERVDLVDLDPEMTRLFSKLPMLIQLNQGSLNDRRVHIFNEDAQKFLERHQDRYQVIIIDLPDPNNESLSKLYTRSFYRLVAQHLTSNGVMVSQATSPFYSTDAFWCIANTMASATVSRAGSRVQVLPYHASVPSFGEWGFVLGALRPLHPAYITLRVATRFLTQELLPSLIAFPKDTGPRPTPINLLDNQILVRLYEQGYKRFNH